MGIGPGELSCLKYCSKHDFGRVITLGRQQLKALPRQISEIIKISLSKSNVLSRDGYIDNLLIQNLGAKSVNSLDYSDYENADLIHDLNIPIKEENIKKFDTLIDVGTLEHVFNIPQALENISNLVRDNGQIIHLLPSEGCCGHGFYQFSPDLFYSIYSEENGFINTEIFLYEFKRIRTWYKWYEVKNPKDGSRVELTYYFKSQPMAVFVRTFKQSKASLKEIQQKDYVERWNNNKSINPGKGINTNYPQKAALMKKIAYKFLDKDQINYLRKILKLISKLNTKPWYKHPFISEIDARKLI